MKRNSAAVAAVVLAIILGNALAGIGPDIAYHVECTDGIDNNQDGFADGDDPECINYPWADGNGESPTESAGYYGESDGYEFYADYIGTYAIDPALQETILCAIEATGDLPSSGWHQGEADRASELINELGINCQGQGP